MLWSDRARSRRLGWPPRSPWGLVALALGLSAALVAVGVAAQGAGVGLAFAVLGVAGLGVAYRLAGASPRYALVRDELGRLFGYTVEPAHAIRFPVERPPALAGGEQGELDWGELAVEELPSGASTTMRVRWRDVAYPHVVAELVGAGR